MKYRKGDFILVPNKEAMRELPMTTQLLWVWLCSYADGYGQCWPSRTRLMKDIGARSVRTVDKHLKKLETLKWIERTNRYSGKKQRSNLYDLNFVDRGANNAPVQIMTNRGANIAHRTKPITNKKKLQEVRMKLKESGVLK